MFSAVYGIIKSARTQNTTLQTNASAQDLGDRRLCAALPSASAGRGVLRPRQRMNRGHAAVYDDSFYHSASDEIHGEASRAASASLEVVASGLGAARSSSKAWGACVSGLGVTLLALSRVDMCMWPVC